MLLQRDVESLIERVWSQLGCRIALPESVAAYLTPKGPLPAEYVDQRRHHRFHYRQKAILTRDGTHAAVYTKNISRTGLGFLTSVQLLPLEEVALMISTGDRVRLVVRRCRRLRQHCYECGAGIVEITRELDRKLLGLISELAGVAPLRAADADSP